MADGSGGSIRCRLGRVAAVAAALAVLLAACQPTPPKPVKRGPWSYSTPKINAPLRPGQIGVLSVNAGWCWWQSERAVISGNTLVVGSVPHASGQGGSTRVTQVLTSDLVTGATRSTTLMANPYPDDDHDSPGLVVNPDGTVTAGWTGHGQDGTLRFATSKPGSFATWTRQPDQSLAPVPANAQTTYSNVLQSEGLLWNFTRRNNRNWAMWSADGGTTWNGGWLLLSGTLGTNGTASQRPYVHFSHNAPLDRIDFVTTAGHPKDIVKGALYSGYIKDFNVYRTDGTLMGPLASGPGYDPTALTEVARPPNTVNNKIAAPFNTADLWGSDLRVDSTGAPVVTYSLRSPTASNVPGKAFAHDYYWARWNGTTWTSSYLGHAGGELFGSEQDYTGLATLDPADPYRVVASSDVNPVTGAPLVSARDGRVHHELFEARSTDSGTTWNWRRITTDSTADNLRPLLATNGQGLSALVWMEGDYRSWRSWTTRALMVVGPPVTTPL
ncbi:hypothetical protein BH10ACT1_BH10ACT1_10590 [soil metagenome]